MQTRSDGVSFPGSKQDLFRWKRFTQNKSEKPKPQLDYDDIEQWVKKVEQASEFAVSEAFSFNKSHLRGKPKGYAVNLETTDQLWEHDEAYIEAQELLNDWMNSKLKMKMVLDEEEDEAEDNEKISTDETRHEVPSFMKYNKFDDLYNCLEQEIETTSTQDFLQELLQKEVINSGVLEDLGLDEDRQKTVKDPHLNMELRHQQVKENRLKRQAQLEHQRREKALKKSALLEAQQLHQEEEKKKVLKARKEEQEIQREMVKLRKEMNERRIIMEEAKKMERQRLELEKAQKIIIHNQAQHPVIQMELQKQHDKERKKLEKMKKLQELLDQIDTNNLKCLHRHFSAWHKVVVERRLMMGKARAMSDWKRQLHAFRAWRRYVWARRAENEAQLTEKALQEENRKQHLAMQSYRHRVLRHFFTEWQLWCRREKEKRELDGKKEETKRKMAALLAAASSGKLCNEQIHEPSRDKEVKLESHQPDTTSQKVDEILDATGRICSGGVPEDSTSHHASPRHAWQVTRKHAALQPQDLEKFRENTFDTAAKGFSDSHQLPGMYPRSTPAYGCNFQHRHMFQQQLIEEQRKQLMEQKNLIQQLQEDQKLKILRTEAERLTAVTSELNCQSKKKKQEKETGEIKPDGSRQQELKYAVPSSSCATELEAHQGETESSPSSSRRIPNSMTSPHPIVKAMEERALQRAKRRKELEEARRKREEEKLAHLRAEEEERHRKEEAEKQAQIEKKREEKRLQKEKELEKQKQAELEMQLKERADKYYQHFLLKKRGLTPWIKLITNAKQNSQLADEHHCAVIQRRCLYAWHYTTKESLEEKTTHADEFYRCMLLRRCLHNWLKCKDFSALLEEKAVRHHLATLKRKTFLVWFDYVNEEKIASWEKKKIATEHNQRRVICNAFHAWRRFPKIIKEEKRREERREQLRKKVAEILPDFRNSQ
ncbi:coiled-coil domain-containing protein 191 [Protopterus annectens]|uniref:coiled-coil domain-containing protein 191 n=1 Tax=Protopterus annectens TaxID=7888 RepID=UPI001CFBC00C|nr:coiled-coil domain-containing protein 191 [Protopterus annectens]